MLTIFDRIIEFIRSYYQKPEGFIPLHEPSFTGNEKKYVLDAIDSTYVSSVGKYVNDFEAAICQYTGSSYAVAAVNGTAALHMSLIVAGVKSGDLVITQPLSFIATCNAITYIGASPLFVDVDRDTLGLSGVKLRSFLSRHCKVKNGQCIHIASGKRIAACVPMHTFGHPAHLNELMQACDEFKIPLVEDAAESIGSKYNGRHTGTFGLVGAFSFNGNKTITCGGGGVIVTNNEALAKLAKHLTTQAKVPHAWEFVHDQIGYNYRLPNLNAAMACAQMEVLDKFVQSKRALAGQYKELFNTLGFEFIQEPNNTYSNYWLNSILFRTSEERNEFLQYSNERQIMTRPVWNLMVDLKMFRHCIQEDLSNAREIAERLVNLPSSPKINEK